jgi:hypothetical protein
MTMMEAQSDDVGRRDPQIRRAPNSSGLYDVLDLILDKGIVIDAFVRVSLVGIELLTVDLRVVVASVDTYLRYAEGVERLQLYDRSGAKRLPDMVGKATKGKVIKDQVNKVTDKLTGSGEEEGEESEHEGLATTIGRGVRSVGGALAHMVGGGGEEDEGDQADDQDDQDEPDLHHERAKRATRSEKKSDRGGSGRNHGRSHAKK